MYTALDDFKDELPDNWDWRNVEVMILVLRIEIKAHVVHVT